MENFKNISTSQKWAIFLTICGAGLCSIIYELLISTTSSYLLGDSIKQFSLVIGVYMASMGLGSWLTKYTEKKLLTWFVWIEILLGLVGGLSVPFLYWSFNLTDRDGFQFLILGVTFLIGLFTGFEVPLLIRFLKETFSLKSNLAYVLSLDYIGALIATLIFPFILLPFLGTFKTSLVFGFSNVIMGIIVYIYFKKNEDSSDWTPIWVGSFFALLLCAFMFYSNQILGEWEAKFYHHKTIMSSQSPYQNIVLTKNRNEVRMYINRIIQWSSVDEYRYHELLGYLPVSIAPYKKNVLVLGGGEGLLAREILKHDEVESLTIVDLDKEIFELAKTNYYITHINDSVFFDKRVHLVQNDAMQFLIQNKEKFEVIISDLPDPSNESLARLYSTSFFQLIKNNLAANGIYATQASSPFHTNTSYWCIVNTIKASGFTHVLPLHNYIPTFGEWGYVMASSHPIDLAQFKNNEKLKYLDSTTVARLTYFDKDLMQKNKTHINTIDSGVLLDYFNKEWLNWSKEQLDNQ